MQNRSHFFPIYFFPRQVALEGRRRPPFMESLQGARHYAEHFIHWSDIRGTGRTCSAGPTTLFFRGTRPNAVPHQWKVDISGTCHVHTWTIESSLHGLLSSLPHLPAGWWPLDDLDKLGLKLGKPWIVPATLNCDIGIKPLRSGGYSL